MTFGLSIGLASAEELPTRVYETRVLGVVASYATLRG